MLILEERFRTGLLLYIWAKYLWLQVLEARQRNVLRIYRTVPEELKEVWGEDKYEQHRILALYRSGFKFFRHTISTAITTVIHFAKSLILFNGFRTLWDRSGDILFCFGYNESNIILHNALFITLLNSLIYIINLPFAAYEVYVMEGRVGMRRVTISGAIIGHVMTQMINFPFVCLFFGLFKIGGNNTFIYMFYFAELQVVLDLCNLDIVDALPPSELRRKIEEFTNQIDFPLYDIYVVKNPTERMHHSKIYIHGSPGEKLVVVYDDIARKHLVSQTGTQDERVLTADLSSDEIVALLAHEIGHWKYGHDFIYFFTNQLYLCLHLFSLHLLINHQPMYRAFGFYGQPYAVGFVLIQNYPIGKLCGSLIRVINRQLEFSADRYAKSVKKEKTLKSAIAKIEKHNFQFPVHDWIYSFCNNNQPSCYERMIALNNYKTNL